MTFGGGGENEKYHKKTDMPTQQRIELSNRILLINYTVLRPHQCVIVGHYIL